MTMTSLFLVVLLTTNFKRHRWRWWLPGTVILFVGDGLEPDCLAFGVVDGDRHVRQFTVRKGTVPVLYTRRNLDHIPFADELDGLASQLVISRAPGDEQKLPARMGVPIRPRAWLERDITGASIVGLCISDHHVHPDGPGKVVALRAAGSSGENGGPGRNRRLVFDRLLAGALSVT